MGMTIEQLCDEVTKLDWINRALRQQIEFNDKRIAEIHNQLLEMKRKEHEQ